MILKAIGKADGYIAATTAEIRAAIDQTRDKPRPSQLAAQQLGAKGA